MNQLHLASSTTTAIRSALADRKLVMPAPWQLPAGADIPATPVRVVGHRAIVSGHVPLKPDGTMADLSGRIGKGADLDLADAQQAAVDCLLSILASLDAELGDLGRIAAWCRLGGMVQAADGFTDLPAVFNPASQLLLDLFGKTVGEHARIAIGMSQLPWNMPVEMEAELELR